MIFDKQKELIKIFLAFVLIILFFLINIYLFIQILIFIVKMLVGSGVFRKLITKIMKVSPYKLLNIFLYYLSICFLVHVLYFLLSIILYIYIYIIEIIMEKLEEKILGDRHEKSLQYSNFQIWFIKKQADIEIFINWIKYDVCSVPCKFCSNEEIPKIKLIRKFTAENIISLLKKCYYTFFRKSILHISIAIFVIYTIYNKEIIYLINSILSVGKNIEISNVNDFFSAITFIIFIFYLIFDQHHKSKGYREIRTARFKELFQMEEKLLNIFISIYIKLEKNIDVITNQKTNILLSGIYKLTGENCCIQENTITYDHQVIEIPPQYVRDSFFPYEKLDDMEEEFQKLHQLDEEFINSNITYSNLSMIDSEALLTKFIHIYFPGYTSFEYMKMQLLCKSIMKKRFENVFIKPTEHETGRIYQSKTRGVETAIEESATLDYDLKQAFILGVYMHICIRKLEKRIKKVHRFSKYDLN